MRFLVAVAALAALPAHADLYRWVDRETGSVKYSSYPPPWYGDPVRELSSPAVEVVRPRAPAASPAQSAKPPATVAALEAQWRRMLDANPRTELFEALSRELDRQDPAGTERRRGIARDSALGKPPAK